MSEKSPNNEPGEGFVYAESDSSLDWFQDARRWRSKPDVEVIASLESENARLAARVKELEARDASRNESKLHSRNVLENAVAKREVENAELRERVAELEAWKAAYLEWQETAAKLIERLQSQLAWTPVSAGLPTEPGAYEFEFRQTSKWRLQITKRGYCWSLLGKPMASHPEEFDEFRRIELPEAV